MQVNVNKAVKMFFSSSSFEMIYNEALANALDAGATEVSIKINLPDPSEIINLSLSISDNGVGFDDTRFGKFSKLFPDFITFLRHHIAQDENQRVIKIFG